VSGFGDAKDLEICHKPRPVRWYLGLNTKDQRGVVARVAEVIGRHDIHIESLGQEPRVSNEELSLGITVESVSEPVICRAVDAINTFVFMVRPVLLLRIESSAHDQE
jgi:glycine cleavage system regulatory protein